MQAHHTKTPLGRPHLELSAQQIAGLARDIAQQGYACLANVFSPEEIQDACCQAVRIVEGNNGEYMAREGTAGLQGAVLADLYECPQFLRILDLLCVLGGARSEPVATPKQVLRCLAGVSGQKQAYYFHFDSFELTALVPIAIPQTGRTGDLLMFPNLRGRRLSYFVSALEKFVYDRPQVQAWIKRRAARSSRVRRLQIRPGNIYIFNGSRTLHANEECDASALRATMLIHYRQTHANHWMRKLRQAT